MKRAALLLASLHPADQAWMFERLPAAVHASLRRHVGELSMMAGRDADTLSRLIASIEAEPDAPAQIAVANAVPAAVLEAVGRIRSRVKDSSPAWVAAALHVQSTEVREAYLGAADEATRASLLQELSNLPAELPSRLAQNLRALVGDPNAPQAMPTFRDMLRAEGTSDKEAAA